LNGRFRTLLDRVLRLRLTPTSAHISREVSFEYLNRQLVWHAFTEFLLFLLPLVGIARWRRLLSRAYRRITTFFLTKFRGRSGADADGEDTTKHGELGFLPERTCAICYKDQTPGGGSEAELLSSSGGGVVGSSSTDITNPYAAIPCGCIYCYVCLTQRLEAEEGEGWTCLRCGELVKECHPWDGDVLEEKVQRTSMSNASVKVVSFTDDADRQTTDAEGDEDDELQNVDPMPLQDDSADRTPTERSTLGASASWINAGPSETETSDYDDDDEDFE
jgi:peroxin-2